MAGLRHGLAGRIGDGDNDAVVVQASPKTGLKPGRAFAAAKSVTKKIFRKLIPRRGSAVAKATAGTAPASTPPSRFVSDNVSLDTSSFGDSLSSSLSKTEQFQFMSNVLSRSKASTRDISFSSAALPSLTGLGEHQGAGSDNVRLDLEVFPQLGRSRTNSTHLFGSYSEDGLKARLRASSAQEFGSKRRGGSLSATSMEAMHGARGRYYDSDSQPSIDMPAKTGLLLERSNTTARHSDSMLPLSSGIASSGATQEEETSTLGSVNAGSHSLDSSEVPIESIQFDASPHARCYTRPESLDLPINRTPLVRTTSDVGRLSSSGFEQPSPDEMLLDISQIRTSFDTIDRRHDSEGSWVTLSSHEMAALGRRRRYVALDRYWAQDNRSRATAFVRISAIPFDVHKRSPSTTPVINDSEDDSALDETVRFSPTLNNHWEQTSKARSFHKEAKAGTDRLVDGIRRYGQTIPDLTPNDEVTAEMLFRHQRRPFGLNVWSPAELSAASTFTTSATSTPPSPEFVSFHRNLTLAALEGRLSPSIHIHSPSTAANGLIRTQVPSLRTPPESSSLGLMHPRPKYPPGFRHPQLCHPANVQRAVWSWEDQLDPINDHQDQEERSVGRESETQF